MNDRERAMVKLGEAYYAAQDAYGIWLADRSTPTPHGYRIAMERALAEARARLAIRGVE